MGVPGPPRDSLLPACRWPVEVELAATTWRCLARLDAPVGQRVLASPPQNRTTRAATGRTIEPARWVRGERREPDVTPTDHRDDDPWLAVTFDGTVERMVWGRSSYTVVRLPTRLVRAAGELGTHRVAGTIEGVAVNLAITRARVLDDPFVYAGAAFLRSIATEVGEPVRCVLAPVDPERVDVPADLEQALREAGAWSVWQARRPGERRRAVAPVESAARPATRARRIADLVQALARDGDPPAPATGRRTVAGARTAPGAAVSRPVRGRAPSATA